MNIWGNDIDQGSRDQIQAAADLPIARGAALLPDAHRGFGLPIGGVLATEGSVIPYGVGQDIACRMRLSITNAAPAACESLQKRFLWVFWITASFGSKAKIEKFLENL